MMMMMAKRPNLLILINVLILGLSCMGMVKYTNTYMCTSLNYIVAC